MNESAPPRLISVDPGGGSAEGDRWRAMNANSEVITQLLAALQGRVLALEGEVAKLHTAQGVGDED